MPIRLSDLQNQQGNETNKTPVRLSDIGGAGKASTPVQKWYNFFDFWKDVLGWLAESAVWVSKLAQNLAKETVVRGWWLLWFDEQKLRQNAERTEQTLNPSALAETIQPVENRGAAFDVAKFVWDTAQVLTPSWLWKKILWKAPAAVDKISKWTDLFSKIAKWWAIWVKDTIKSNLISEWELPSVWEVWLWWVIWWALPLASKGVNILWKGAKSLSRQILWKTTWTSAETINTAVQQAGNKWFLDAMRWNVSPDDVVNEVRGAMKTVKGKISDSYEKSLEKLLQDEWKDKVWNIDNIFKEMKSFVEGKTKWLWASIGLDGKVKFKWSVIQEPKAQNEIKWIVKTFNERDDFTANWLNRLKRALKWYAWVSAAPEAKGLATNIRSLLDKEIENLVPWYKKMNEAYNLWKTQLKDISQALASTDRTSKFTAVTRLNQILKENQEFKKQMLDLLEKESGKNLVWKIAGTQLTSLTPKGLVWAGLWGWLVFGWLFNPTLRAWALLSSPRLIWETANVLWISQKKLTSMLSRLPKWSGNVAKRIVPALSSKSE